MTVRALLVVVAVGLAAGALAQQPPAGSPHHGQGAMPMTEPAPPDTAIVRFAWPGPGPTPTAMAVAPGRVVLGDVFLVILDLPSPGDASWADSLQADVDWLEPALEVVPSLPDDIPAPRGTRVVVPMRAYRLGPWRAAWADGAPGPLLAVSGRLDAAGAIVPVRDPRAFGGLPLWVLILVAGLVLLAAVLLLMRRWRGRARAAAAPDQPLPPPAWLAAALDLWQLEQTTGHDRAFLDSLAAIVRRYLDGRFHLPAQEMTAEEIAAAATRAGWPARSLQAFARLLAACDTVRYAPAGVGSQRCREDMQLVLDLIDGQRVEPVWSPVPATARAEATTAWQELRRRYPGPVERGAAC